MFEQNEAEVSCIVDLIRDEYEDKAFRVLTPYDSQRNALENALKAAGLPWEDKVRSLPSIWRRTLMYIPKVFNVDSFQGQEADIVIISIVRTARLGFLGYMKRSCVVKFG